MNTNPKLSILIASYKDGAFLDDCIDSIKGQYYSYEIIIKNQKSETSEETFQRISQKYPDVIMINGENNGLSAGFNECVKASKGDFLLFLGADIRFNSPVIEDLVNYMEKNSYVGGATAELHLGDGSIDLDAHRAFPTPWISFSRLFGLQKLFPNSNFFNGYFLPDRNMNEPHEIDMCISHFMIVPRRVYDQIGGFDEAFFLYGEDVDFCYRIKEAGYKIMYLPHFKVQHLKGGSVGIRKTTRDIVKRPLEHRLKMQRLTTESMVTFLKKHYFKKYPSPFVYFMILGAYILGFIRVSVEKLRK